MTTTLSQGQAELPRLVELASQGEDVVITVEGKPKAPLTRAADVVEQRLQPEELASWTTELAALRQSLTTGKTTPSAEQIVSEDREGHL